MVGSGRGHQQCGTLDGLDAILCLLPPVALPRLQVFTRPARQSLSLDFFPFWEELSSAFLVHYSQSAMPSFCLSENVRLVCIGLALKSLENI